MGIVSTSRILCGVLSGRAAGPHETIANALSWPPGAVELLARALGRVAYGGRGGVSDRAGRRLPAMSSSLGSGPAVPARLPDRSPSRERDLCLATVCRSAGSRRFEARHDAAFRSVDVGLELNVEGVDEDELYAAMDCQGASGADRGPMRRALPKGATLVLYDLPRPRISRVVTVRWRRCGTPGRRDVSGHLRAAL